MTNSVKLTGIKTKIVRITGGSDVSNHIYDFESKLKITKAGEI